MTMILISSFLLVFLHILYIILTDTSGIHGLPLLPFSIWILFLTVYSGVLGFKFLQSLEKTKSENLFKAILTFFFFSAFFLIFEINQRTLLIIVFNSILATAFVIWALFSLSKMYTPIHSYVGVVIIFLSFHILPFLNPYTALLQELVIVLAFLYRVSKFELRSKVIIFLSSILGVLVSFLVNSSDIASTISRILIEQIFGIDSGGTFLISSPISLAIHITLLIALFTHYLLTKEHFWLLLILTGMSFSIGPIVIIRALALYHLLLTYKTNNETSNIKSSINSSQTQEQEKKIPRTLNDTTSFSQHP